MSRIAVIVAPVDFTKSSIEALNDAATWAKDLGSELHLLHVVPDPTSQAWSAEAFAVNFEAVGQEWMEKAQRDLDALVPALQLPADRVKTRVEMGRPGEQIVAYGKELDAGLIIMASGEHGRVARLLLGSVADYVVRTATCPVLIIPVHAHSEHQAEDAPAKVRTTAA